MQREKDLVNICPNDFGISFAWRKS